MTVIGPRGPVQGALVVEKLHMDGTLEDKIFAPGYDEFSTGSGANLEAVALAVPIDALPTPVPGELLTLSSGAAAIFQSAQSGDWNAASAAATMTAARNTFKAGNLPPMLEEQMNGALAGLVAAVAAQQTAEARQAAINVGRAGLGFQPRHRSVAEIDLDHLELWVRHLVVDLAAGDQGGVLSDIAIMKWITDRLAGQLAAADLRQIAAQISGLRGAAAARNLPAAIRAVARLGSGLTNLGT